MSVTALLRVLLARWKMIAGILFTVVIMVGLATFKMPKMYRASTDLIVNTTGQDTFDGYIMSPQQVQAHIATQSDVIRSAQVTQKVISMLALHERPELIERYNNANIQDMSIQQWLGRALINNLSVIPRRGSTVLTIAVDSAEPEFAAELANTYAEAYLQATLELRIEPAKRITVWYQKQLADLKTNYEAAQKALSDYQETHGIVSLDERLDIETARLTELSSQLVDAQNQRLNSQSRNSQLSSNSNDTLSADVLSNPLIMGLKTDLNAAQTRLDELSTRVGVNHPQYRQALNEVQSLEDRLSRTRELVGTSMRSDTKSLVELETQLSSALEAQKEKVLTLNRRRNELDLMRQEVTNAQSIYDATMTRATQAQLESQRASTDIMVLNSAAVPRVPVSPNFAMNLFIGTLLGALFGTAAALCIEWFDRRVRSPGELETLLGLPVLACIPSGHSARTIYSARRIFSTRKIYSARTSRISNGRGVTP